MSTRLSMFQRHLVTMSMEQTETVIEQIIRPTGLLGSRGGSASDYGTN